MESSAATSASGSTYACPGSATTTNNKACPTEDFLHGCHFALHDMTRYTALHQAAAKRAFVICRPAKRAKRSQGTSSTLQSQRQAWMSQLTADAAHEVTTAILCSQKAFVACQF